MQRRASSMASIHYFSSGILGASMNVHKPKDDGRRCSTMLRQTKPKQADIKEQARDKPQAISKPQASHLTRYMTQHQCVACLLTCMLSVLHSQSTELHERRNCVLPSTRATLQSRLLFPPLPPQSYITLTGCFNPNIASSQIPSPPPYQPRLTQARFAIQNQNPGPTAASVNAHRTTQSLVVHTNGSCILFYSCAGHVVATPLENS